MENRTFYYRSSDKTKEESEQIYEIINEKKEYLLGIVNVIENYGGRNNTLDFSLDLMKRIIEEL